MYKVVAHTGGRKNFFGGNSLSVKNIVFIL